MNITESTIIVACTEWSVWNFVETEAEQQAQLKRAKEYVQESIETWKKHIKRYPDAKKQPISTTKTNYRLMTYGEYEAAQAKYFADKPVIEITEEEWMENLEVLPPVAWQTINGVNEFLMSEFLTGPYTAQYARCNGKYYTKTVNAYDKSTWIHNLIK